MSVDKNFYVLRNSIIKWAHKEHKTPYLSSPLGDLSSTTMRLQQDAQGGMTILVLAISLLSTCFLMSCSDTQVKPIALPTAPPPPTTPKISPETAYLRSLGSKAKTWNLTEVASFAFIAKKQIETIRVFENEDIFKSPLYRNKFLAQLYALSTVLTYLRVPLANVNHGDVAPIRATALKTIKLSNFARKTRHTGEALVFFELTKEAYLKSIDLSTRELLKPRVPAPYISEDLRISVFKAFESVHDLIETFELGDKPNKEEELEDIRWAIRRTFNAVIDMQEQTDGFGYNLLEDPASLTPKPTSIITPFGEVVPSAAQSYGFPSAQQLLQSGNTSQTTTTPMSPPSPMTSPMSFSSPALNSGFTPQSTVAGPPPNTMIDASLVGDVRSGPYGSATMATSPVFGGSTSTTSDTASALPSLGALLGGSYSGAPTGQPTPAAIPNIPPPAPAPPPPSGGVVTPLPSSSPDMSPPAASAPPPVAPAQ